MAEPETNLNNSVKGFLGDKGASTVVAIGFLTLIGLITLAAIIRYKTVDDALQIWGSLSGLVGVVIGSLAAYFFTKDQVDQAKEQLSQANQQATESNEQARLEAQHAREAEKAVGFLLARSDPKAMSTLKNEPALKAYFN